jgi:deoxyribodipyrimidine photo-lyase
MIHGTRIRHLNEEPVRRSRGYLLYWMQRAQRACWNHALEHAIRLANELELPLLAGFALTPAFPGGNRRSYAFMLDGLGQTQGHLAERGIPLVVRQGDPPQAIAALAANAALVVTDRGYLRAQRAWRRELADGLPCRLVQVETDAVVPADVATQKEEYAARTIRPRIHRHLDDYLVALEETPLERDGLGHPLAEGASLGEASALLDGLDLPKQPAPVSHWRGGPDHAHALLDAFCQERLPRYAEARNEPAADATSHLSPYLHFGQISPLEVALRAREHRVAHTESVEAFLEELIVRRELAINLCLHHPSYDSIACLPDWARGTLADHADDPRPVRYTPQQLETAETQDAYWNAAQREMLVTGKMQGYMRMYWGKKILEWTPDPAAAYDLALTLNDRYELDGRDPNGYAGVAWCFGKHDQAWKERPILGKVRYMNANGLERKFDMDAYVARVDALASAHEEPAP